MPAGNPLLGSMATPQVTAGYATGVSKDSDLWPDASKSSTDSDRGCSAKVALILGASVLFIVMLRRGGFRDMVTV